MIALLNLKARQDLENSEETALTLNQKAELEKERANLQEEEKVSSKEEHPECSSLGKLRKLPRLGLPC